VNPSSRASCDAVLSSLNNRWEGDSVSNRSGRGGIALGGDFSGLLGGVLNGDTRRSDEARLALGAASIFDSCNARLAGFAGILGLSARLAGGGKEALFAFRSDGLSRIVNLAECNSPGDKLPGTVELGDPGR